jgi:hypothetical protein
MMIRPLASFCQSQLGDWFQKSEMIKNFRLRIQADLDIEKSIVRGYLI